MVLVPHQVSEPHWRTIDQNQTNFSMRHAQRLDYVFDGSVQEERMRECRHPLFRRKKVVEFSVKPKNYLFHGNSDFLPGTLAVLVYRLEF